MIKYAQQFVMPGKSSQAVQAIASSRATPSGPSSDAIRGHLNQVINAPAFKGSRRSQEFLQYIVDKALQGQFDALKERVLGVELFGRPAAYDTSEDAIVRVTASDLRRRLQQFYASAGPDCALRIELPSGSYIPDFRWAQERPVPLEIVSASPTVVTPTRRMPRAALFAAAGLLLVCAGYWASGRFFSPRLTATVVQPWAAMFHPKSETRIIFCDPDISLIQRLLGFQITLSDYANRRYRPANRAISAEMKTAVDAMRGTKVAFADASTALNIAELAASTGHRVKTHTARGFQLLDFKTDDSFIVLGSPRSNPWLSLFQDKLDFQFEHDAATDQEIIVNKRAQKGELSRYFPTAQGGGTGQAYAILGFVPNPGQKGNVLLLAGSSAEATEAAGRLATNIELLSRTLRENGIDPVGQQQPFEILLRVATMAGSPNTFEVIACHKLAR